MKAAVFVSAGLGDALLLVPLVKELKKQGAEVSGFFTSSFGCETLFKGTSVFNEIIVSPELISAAVFSSLQNFKKFDTAYLNFFAVTKKNLFLASSVAKKIVTNNPEASSFCQSRLGKLLNLEIITPVKGIHDAAQNLRLLNPAADDSLLSEEIFSVDFPEITLNEKHFPELNNLKNKKYFAVQISSGNNIQKYKNWNTKHWIDFLKLASEKFPGHNFILLGEPRETEIAETILKAGIPNVFSVAGRTGIPEVIEFISHAEIFIGLDGGLMHIAAASGKPTFTLWGASDFNLYGYEKINPLRHRVIYKEISCRPCNSWINPNTTRVKKPIDCPDYICMQNLKPDFVFSEFQVFYDKLSLT